MYKPVVLFIGLRYMHRHTVDLFSRFISWLSIIGITIGVMAMITVLSIMNGFEHELQNNILGFMPHAVLSSSNGFINPLQLPESTVKLKGVNHVTPLTTSNIVLHSASSVALGVILGINPVQSDPLTSYLVDTKQTDLKPGKYNIILGEQLARQLSVNKGDILQVIVPSVSQFTLVGRIPSQRLFKIIGTFSSKSEVDSYQVLANIQDASRLMHYPKGNITGWRLWLNEPVNVEFLGHQKLPKGTKLQDWRNRKGELFRAIHMEKNMMGLLLSLIIVISAFNIITSLSLMVMEKQGDIAILQTQGLTKRQIILIFMIKGVSSGIIGAFLGAILGVLLASQLNYLMSIIGVLINDVILPVYIKPLQIINIMLITITISLLSTLYPSWRAAMNQPSEILRAL